MNPTKYSQERADNNYDSSAFDNIADDTTAFRNNRVNNSSDLEEAEVDVEAVQKVLQVGFKDKRQLKKQKKQVGAQANP